MLASNPEVVNPKSSRSAGQQGIDACSHVQNPPAVRDRAACLPAVFATPAVRRAEGCRVWDFNGNAFVSYAASGQSTTLGHGYKPVCDAADQYLCAGLTEASSIDLDRRVAEEMVGLIDSADTVAFRRDGADAVAGAVEAARAYTGRELVARCVDQVSAGDAMPSFRFNDLPSTATMFERFPGQIACVVLEAETNEPPATAYLHRLQTLCHEHDAVFVLDETNTGFRWHTRGAQKLFNFRPDLSCFGTTMANGYAVAALCGKRDMMRLVETGDAGRVGRRLSRSATASALAACLATIQTYRENDVVTRLERQGNRLKRGLLQVIADAGVLDYVKIVGRAQALGYMTFDVDKRPSAAFRELFQRELVARSVIAPNFVVCTAHDDAAVDQTIDAVAAVLPVYRNALGDGATTVTADARCR